MFDVAVTVEFGEVRKDLVVQLDSSMSGRDLIGALCGGLGVPAEGVLVRLRRTATRVEPDASLEPLAVRTGDVFVLDRSPGGAGELAAASSSLPPTSTVGLAVHAIAGPHVGLWAPLELGDNVLGRQRDSVAVALPADEAASRVHATLTVALDGSVTIADNGSTNGTLRNGAPVTEPVAVALGDRLGVGDTELVLEAVDRPSSDGHLVYSDGSLGFNRQPRVISPKPSNSFTLSAPPDKPPKRRLPLSAALVPVAMGVAMFLMTKSPMYLMFTLMGPVMAVWSFVDDRRSGRKDFDSKARAFREGLRVQARQIDRARAEAITWRRSQHPDLDSLDRWIRAGSPQLWSRRLSDTDALDLRLGTADVPSLVGVATDPGGDEDLQRLAEGVAAASVVDHAVPVVAPLRELGVLGVVGAGVELDGLLRALTIELAALHSPRDVAIVGLAPGAPRFSDWAKWLPHARSLSDDGGATIAVDDASAQSLFESVKKLADARREAAAEALGGSMRFAPQLVVVVQPPVRIPPKEMAALLAAGPSVGISVIWFAGQRSELPNDCQAILELDPHRGTAGLTFAATGQRIDGVAVEGLDPERAIAMSRGLAPLRDTSSGSGGEGIPDRVSLPELIGMVPPTGEAVLQSWQQDPGDLSAPIGAGPFGPVSIDLRRDGPHGLVAGTTGAGKSEFLQSLVASLAVAHSPAWLTFVFVDYKGGAAFQECVHLPHSLGIVTDLDAHLTRRALVSLNAELRRREHLILEAGAADLRDMAAKAPERAPASMLIIIDEFAALAREVPEFVDGVVDIAQRGRSLGIHLLLATQTPRGVINDKIQANTNLRVALRTADADESRNILERPDAALIPRSVPGRGFVKTGPTEVVEFQSAYVGGATDEADDQPAAASARTFALSMAERQAAYDAARSDRAQETDLRRIVDAANAAMRLAHLAEPHKPWLPPLATMFALDALLTSYPSTGDHLALPLGVADAPDQQTQYSWALDLDSLGSVVVYGGPGAGKTTVLRSMALSAAQRFSPDELWVYGLDFGSRGLLGLAALPHSGGVVAGDDLDRVRRLIAMLESLAAERRTLLGTVGAGSTVEYRRSTGDALPEVLVLLDNFAAFWTTMDPIDRSQHNQTLLQLVAEGKGVGLHFAISADRRSAIPPAMASTISGRLVLRMANPEEYASLGLRDLEKAPPSAPGRAFTEDGLEIQIAVASTSEGADGVQQLAYIESRSAELRERFPTVDVPQVRLLPDVVSVSDLPAPTIGSHRVSIGIEERSLAPVSVDLDADPLFLVAGPAVGGRTNALVVVASRLLAADPAVTPWLLASRKTPLADCIAWAYSGIGVEQATSLAHQLASLADERATVGWTAPLLVVVDDADEFAEGSIANHLDVIQRRARDAGIILLFAVTSFKAKRLYAGWATALRNNRHGLVLQPDLETDGDIFGQRLPQRANLQLPIGRGFLITRSGTELVQVARGL